MPLPDRFCVDLPESVPTYSYGYTCQPTISYRYPCETNIVYRCPTYSTVSYYDPCEVVVRNGSIKSETADIRRDLQQIRTDLKQIKQQQRQQQQCVCPTYYELKPACCDSCQEKNNSGPKMYCCEQCKSFVEKPSYSVVTKLRAKTPNTTYQDSYRPPSCCSSAHGHIGRRVTLNELQTESAPSTGPVQHPRPWVPTGRKNQYPCRQWNLSVPHSEP